MCWRRKLVAVLFLALTSLWQPRHAHASACCLGASAVGTGRLLNWELLAVGLQTSLVAGMGYWSTTGDWRAHGSDYRELDWRNDLWVIAALGWEGIRHRFSFQGHLPWTLNYRMAGNLGSGYGGNLADVSLALRYDVIEVGQIPYVPGIALSLGAVAPTGRSSVDAISSDDLLQKTVTGRGAWIVSAALSVEAAVYPWFLRVDCGVNVPMEQKYNDPSAGAQVTQRYGTSVQSALTGGYGITATLVASAFFRFRWEDDLSTNGSKVPGSYHLEPGAGVGLAWRFHPHLTVQGSLDTGIFASAFGHNAPGQLTTMLGLRYGYF